MADGLHIVVSRPPPELSDADFNQIKGADAGALPLPGWWGRAQFASWNCLPLGERRGPRT